MTEKKIQNHLFQKLQKSSSLIIPNYTPAGWWECDLFSLTKAGYFIEHEIKLSLVDFKVDAKKARRGFNKHDLLLQGDPRGPKHFYYVVPPDLEERVLELLPVWAGLKVVKGFWIRTVRRAPTIHTVKPSSSLHDHARGVIYWRFWSLRCRLDDTQLLADTPDEDGQR